MSFSKHFPKFPIFTFYTTHHMRKEGVFFLVFYFAITSATFSLDSLSTSKIHPTRYVLGFEISCLNKAELEFNDGVTFVPEFLVEKTRHTLGIGPVLSFFSDQKTKTFRGISGHYEYCPFSYSEKLSFGVRYSLAYTFQKTHYDEFMEWSPGQFYSTSFKSEWHALDNYIGYTLKIRLYRNLSLENSLGFGVQFYNYNTSTDIAENKTLSWSYSSGNIFSKSESSSLFVIGLRYDFR